MHEKPAYHYKGTLISNDDLNVITGIIKIDDLKKITKKYNCTITCLLASLYILSIQELYNKEHKKKNKEIKILLFLHIKGL